LQADPENLPVTTKGNGKSQPKWSSDERLEVLKRICELKNKEGGALSQKDIVAKLRDRWEKLSEKDVSTIFNDGIDKGLVHITFIPPLESNFALKLKSLWPQLIKHVAVGVSKGSAAQVAARYFEETLGDDHTIVLDGGRTVREFVMHVNPEIELALKIIPIAADPPSYEVSAYELMTRLSAKLPRSECLKLPYHRSDLLKEEHAQVVTAAKGADVVLLGAGPFHVGWTACDFVKHLGVDPAKFHENNPEIVCMCGYLALDRDGNELTPREFDMPRSLRTDDLRLMAADKTKTIALLANGEQKCEAVATILKAGIVNTLFLDVPLAKALLDDSTSCFRLLQERPRLTPTRSGGE